MNAKGVCRTAPATPGVLTMSTPQAANFNFDKLYAGLDKTT